MSVRVYHYGVNPWKAGAHYTRVSKSTAMKWWAWGTHVFISKRVMQERYPNPLQRIANRRPPPTLGYSPHKLPPMELPHMHFEEPKSAAWREAHRKVTFR